MTDKFGNIVGFPVQPEFVKQKLMEQAPSLIISAPKLAQLTFTINYIQFHKGYFPENNYHWLHEMLEMHWPASEVLHLIP